MFLLHCLNNFNVLRLPPLRHTVLVVKHMYIYIFPVQVPTRCLLPAHTLGLPYLLLLVQADKLVSKSTFPENANNNEMARHLYYLGTLSIFNTDCQPC